MRETHLMAQHLNTFVYKRTHTGDPNTSGEFGCSNCMGGCRGWSFDAVIGVGGKSPDRGHEDIAYKINWIGIGPSKVSRRGLEGLLVTFERFVLWEEAGPSLKEVAPKLSKHMFKDNKHFVMSQNLPSETMQEEVQKILALAETFQLGKPSRVFEKTTSTNRRC